MLVMLAALLQVLEGVRCLLLVLLVTIIPEPVLRILGSEMDRHVVVHRAPIQEHVREHVQTVVLQTEGHQFRMEIVEISNLLVVVFLVSQTEVYVRIAVLQVEEHHILNCYAQINNSSVVLFLVESLLQPRRLWQPQPRRHPERVFLHIWYR